nr:MAG TPA: hypothetical protein [Caudoviricetes sp.]
MSKQRYKIKFITNTSLRSNNFYQAPSFALSLIHPFVPQ